jgi:hypothetical protein
MITRKKSTITPLAIHMMRMFCFSSSSWLVIWFSFRMKRRNFEDARRGATSAGAEPVRARLRPDRAGALSAAGLTAALRGNGLPNDGLANNGLPNKAWAPRPSTCFRLRFRLHATTAAHVSSPDCQLTVRDVM